MTSSSAMITVRTAAALTLLLSSAVAAADPVPDTITPWLSPSRGIDGLSFTTHGITGRVSAYLQAQYEHHDDSEEQLSDDGLRSLNYDRFLLRRGRVVLGLEGGPAEGLLELDANTTNGMQLGIRQGEASLRYRLPGTTRPLVMLTVGLFRVPFGFENPQSARDRIWLENGTLARAFFPGESDLGARLRGSLGWFEYALAVTNGHPIEEAHFGAQAPTGPRDFVGRVGFGGASGTLNVSGGISLLYGQGFHAGTAATKDTVVVRDVNETGVATPQSVQLVPGRAATPSQNFDRWAAGADVQISLRPFRALAMSLHVEAAFAQNLDRWNNPADPIGQGFEVREFGFVADYTQLLFERVLMGVRVDYYDPNADAIARQGGRIVSVPRDTLTGSFLLGVQWPRTQHRLIAQYDSIRDHLALDADGHTVDLRNNRVTIRLQVAF